MALRAGTLNKRVILQTVGTSADGRGGVTETWSDTTTLWAHVEELSGSESFESQQIASNLTHRVTLRYRTSVVPQQRLKYGTRILKIVSVTNPDQRNEMLQLMCSEEDI